MSVETAHRLRAVLSDPAVAARYREKIVTVPPYACCFWTGAVTGHGHGRLWIAADSDVGRGSRDFVVIAHRFGYGLEHGFETLMDTEVVAHLCDNPLCQEPRHWEPATHAENKRQWAARRHQVAGPLRDRRGARARAVEIREAVLAGRPLPAVFADGVRPLDRDQLLLWQ